MILGLVAVGARGLTNPQIFLNIGLPLGGIGVMTAAMFAFAEGNTFLVSSIGAMIVEQIRWQNVTKY
jgi:succinate-acetate transporter protein